MEVAVKLVSRVETPLVLGADGKFYGTTTSGGTGTGTFFQLTTAGALTTLVQFTGSSGASTTDSGSSSASNTGSSGSNSKFSTRRTRVKSRFLTWFRRVCYLRLFICFWICFWIRIRLLIQLRICCFIKRRSLQQPADGLIRRRHCWSRFGASRVIVRFEKEIVNL